MKVTAVVLDWNGHQDTLACLRSLREVSGLDILVVDNGSRPRLAEACGDELEGVTLLENEQNLGYAGGNNIGLKRALADGAEAVWVLNNDTVVDPEALDLLLACLERHPRAAAVAPAVLSADDPSRLWVAWGEVNWLQSLVRLVGQGREYGPRWQGEREVPWLPGCSVLFRRAALEAVGLFDENYFAYHEDVDWAARARELGWSMHYSGLATVVHRGSASSAGYSGFKRYLSARNSVLYARRHGSFQQRVLLAAAIVLTLPFQYLRRLATGEQGGVQLKLRGWLDGLTGRPIPFEQLHLR